jgi:hypothetical protein
VEKTQCLVNPHASSANQCPEDFQKQKKDLLYLALQESMSAAIIRILIEAYPDGLKRRDDFGRSPIFSAILKSASSEVIKVILEAWPEGAKSREDGDFFPLLACHRYYSFDVINLLLYAHPEGAREIDHSGNLPLYRVCMNNSPVEVSQLIFETY